MVDQYRHPKHLKISKEPHTKTMRTSQALSYAVIVLLLASSSSSHASVLKDTCKSFGANYDYCIKFFQADKDSATADRHGITVIAIKIARAAAASTLKRIPVLKEGDKDKKIQGPLATCDAVYNGAINDCDEALRDITSGRIEDALMSLGY